MHRLPSQTRRHSAPAPAPAPTGLKRSGAIRRQTNPLLSTQEPNERPVMHNRSYTTPTARQDRPRVRIKVQIDDNDDNSASSRPSEQTPAMDHLVHVEDFQNEPVFSSSDDESDSDTDSESEDSQRWQDALEWNLERVGQLRDMLRIWVEGDVPADEIGDFLVSCLHDCDDHLDNRVTRMVDEHETYAHIAYVLVEYFQIRDGEDKPLWTQIKPGDSERRPGHGANGQICDCETNSGKSDTDTPESTMHIVAPRPVRPVRWPLFLRNLKSGHLSDSSADGEFPQKSIPVQMQHDAIALIGSAERKVLIETSKSQSEFLTAEMITPRDPKYPIRTNKSKNRRASPTQASSRSISPADVGPFHLTELLDSPVPEWDWL